jgi:hypothetical protein
MVLFGAILAVGKALVREEAKVNSLIFPISQNLSLDQ